MGMWALALAGRVCLFRKINDAKHYLTSK